MRVLAFDTSSPVMSVAVLDNETLVAEMQIEGQSSHAERLLKLTEQVLARGALSFANIDLVAVGLGPGLFTGTRVGVATAKGLVYAARKPIVGVCSLEVLAMNVAKDDRVIMPMTNAYKGEVYAALYRAYADKPGQLVEVMAPFHATPTDAARSVSTVVDVSRLHVLGSGARTHASDLPELKRALVYSVEDEIVHASALARCALKRFQAKGGAELHSLEPAYVRPPDAQLPKHALTAL